MSYETLIKLFEKDVLAAFFEAVKQHEDLLKDLNNEQLNRGIDGKGQAITPYYTDGYKRFKKSKGLQTSVVDLKLSGDYHRSKEVKYFGTKDIAMFSDIKVGGFGLGEHLRERYGKDIEGLTKENEDLFFELIYDDFIRLWQG
jgi:hypothetical protein